MVFPQIELQQVRWSVVELPVGWDPVGDIADGGVFDGVVMLSCWVRKGSLCVLPREEGCCFCIGII